MKIKNKKSLTKPQSWKHFNVFWLSLTLRYYEQVWCPVSNAISHGYESAIIVSLCWFYSSSYTIRTKGPFLWFDSFMFTLLAEKALLCDIRRSRRNEHFALQWMSRTMCPFHRHRWHTKLAPAELILQIPGRVYRMLVSLMPNQITAFTHSFSRRF